MTATNAGLVLNIAVNYGGRAEITRAVQLITAAVAAGSLRPEDIGEELISNHCIRRASPIRIC
jgi:undecaprenyl diphosphate synthase